ncbi:tetratricopeptide repeat protein [Cytophagales bacterium LB-30]|uniref:Tetratricopeptide repeat protein n=1 Tax=Shiella aurantiaca TaxID=3058365 RepID=A0ABT8F1U4_9BACT|nr:tetratricopeptide repeat protein [Shiella aurantiaca]MDN4164413.1 tetratricopeptide repeat protein [Shiella aurantiaca]
MKKLAYAIVLIGTITFSGCALQKMIKTGKNQQVTAVPSPLELHGDSVKFDITAVLPVKTLKKGKVYTITPTYEYGEQVQELDGVVFEADKFPNAATEQPQMTKKQSFKYEPAMASGDLMIKAVASDPRNGKSKESEKVKLTDGIITTSTMVKEVYYAAYADHGYNNKEELVPTNVEFFFEQGRSVLRTSEKSSDRGKSFTAFVADKNVTRTVTITGTHSPEGTERINSGLSEDRATAIETYYRQMMKKYDYKGLADSIKFILKPVVEDWSGFKAALNEYTNISAADKDAMLQIVNGSGSFEEKEKQLQKFSSYKSIFKDIYPKLRTAKTEILSVKDKKSDAEISVLAKQIAESKVSSDTLSVEELLYSATLTPSLKEKEAIYTAATKKDQSAAAHNNLGAVYIEMAMEAESDEDMKKYVDMAVAQLELSVKIKETAEAATNLGVAYLMQGNAAKAAASLQKAISLNPASEVSRGLNGVLGAIQIRMAQYGPAVSSLSKAEESADNLFNKGLAQLLSKDFQNARTSFIEATEKDAKYAAGFYGAAIASARLKDENSVVSNLSKAVAIDPSLKEKALNDLEFANFSGSEAFRNALK